MATLSPTSATGNPLLDAFTNYHARVSALNTGAGMDMSPKANAPKNTPQFSPVATDTQNQTNALGYVDSTDPNWKATVAAPASKAISAATSDVFNNNYNNPGNLRDTPWTRSLPGYVGPYKGFAQFDNHENGVAAMERNLIAYGHHNLDTPLKITNSWAPSGDGSNDPQAYANYIATSLGIKPTDQVDLSDPTSRRVVMRTISAVETGHWADMQAQSQPQSQAQEP